MNPYWTCTGRSFFHLVTRVKNHACAFRDTVADLAFEPRAATDLDGLDHGLALLDRKDCPAITMTEGGVGRHLEHVAVAPYLDACLHSVAIAEPLP